MFVQTKEDIFGLLARHRADLEGFGVDRCGLFGSFVSGTPNADSDVDVLVEFAPGRKNFDSFMALSFFLEDILGRRVDLLTPESLSPHIGPKILSEVEYGLID